MKKVLALCLVAVLCVSLAACGREEVTLTGTYSASEGYLRFVFKDDGTLTGSSWGRNFRGTYEKTEDGWSLLLQLEDAESPSSATAVFNDEGELVIEEGNLKYFLKKE